MLVSVTEALDGLSATSNAIYSSDSIISDISAAVAQQDSATSEIALSAQMAAQTSERSASECTRIAAVAKETKGSAEKIEHSCRGLVGATATLKSQLSQSIKELRGAVWAA